MTDIIDADPFIKQIVTGQSIALISIANWMSKQPTAHRRTLEGIAVALTGTPIIMKHMGQEELGATLAATLSEAVNRCRTLPEPTD